MSLLTSKFPSIKLSFDKSISTTSKIKLIGLYFASDWCPDCTPVTPKLKELYEKTQQSNDDDEIKFEILYVSSDDSKEQMMNSYKNKHGTWNYIDYDNVDERNAIKQYFQTCAKKEMVELTNIKEENRIGIPALIFTDTATEQIITRMDGPNMLDEYMEAMERKK